MKAKWIPALLAAALSQGFADESPTIEYKPLSIGALMEMGVLKSGRFGGNPKNLKNEWTDHTGAFFTQEATVGGNLVVRAGFGGLFQFQKPEKINPNWGGTQYRNFFVGPTVADFTYHTGPVTLGLGMFPYKYNPDAGNLGEYMLRCGPYPGYLWSGGYSFVGDNQAYLQGFKSKFTAGDFTAELLALTETTLAPLYDISLAAIVKYRLGDGLLDLTAGANLKRILPIHPSKTTQERKTNAYFTNAEGTWTGKVNYYVEQANFYKSMADTATARGQDPAAFIAQQTLWQGRADKVRAWTSDTAAVKPAYEYYTQAGVILMAAAALDMKKFIPLEAFGPNDMRLYFEAALLGVKDYPVFYEKKAERMPIMAGFNLPGFRFLDLVSLQVEYYNSPWINSYEESVQSNEATPYIPGATDRLYSKDDYKDVTKDDNLYWSLLIKKQVMAGLYVSGQVARDHIRSVSEASWSGPGTDPGEILYSKNDWYWMLQFSFGI